MANQIHDAFDNIRADAGLKESTKQFLSRQQRANVPSLRSPRVSKMLVGVCALLLFVVAGFGGYSWIQAPVSYVSIDVNPSVELALNRLDRVVDITAFNTDGAVLIEGLSLKGKKYTDAVNLIVEGSGMEEYLSDDAELVFTVAAPGARSGELQTGIEGCHSYSGHRCYSASADIELVAAAHEYGLSLGKYYAYLQLAAYDDTITVDDCREMSMSEIHRCIRGHGGHSADGVHGQGHWSDDEEYENPGIESSGYGDSDTGNTEYEDSDTGNSGYGDSDVENGEYDASDSGNSGNDSDDDKSGDSGSGSHHGGHGRHGGGHE